jgi:hypothetical protein
MGNFGEFFRLAFHNLIGGPSIGLQMMHPQILSKTQM